MLPTAPDLWSRRPRRAWWQRVIQLAPVRVLIALVLLVPGGIVASLAENASYGWPARTALSLASAIMLCGMIAAYAWGVEGRTPRELGPRRAGREWLAGVGGGALLFAAALSILVALGGYRVAGGGSASALATSVVLFASPALFEEACFRVVIFKLAEESLGTWPAIAIQALLFGAIHAGNPNVTVFSVLAIALEAGVLLAAAYMLTRRVWLAWGMHFGWNAMQGSVFGVTVSGLKIEHSLLHSTPTGAPWLNGGDFGVEASPVATVVCLAGAVLLLRAAARRSRVVTLRDARARIAAQRTR